MSESNDINKKIAAGMIFVSSITGLMKASPIEEYNHNSQPDVSSSQTGESPSIYTTLTHGQSLNDQIEESYGKNFEQTKEKRDRDLETALQADQEKSRTASGSPEPDPQKQTVPNHEKMPQGDTKSMETFKKPKQDKVGGAETHPKDNITPAKQPNIDTKVNQAKEQDMGEGGARPGNGGGKSDISPEQRVRLEELRTRGQRSDSQTAQTPLDDIESGNQSNEEPTQSSPRSELRGNPNLNPYVSEVNGKMEPGNTIGAEKMANLTAKHNEILNNVGQKYRATSDAALNNALAERYAPKEQPTANSEPQEVNQDGTRS